MLMLIKPKYKNSRRKNNPTIVAKALHQITNILGSCGWSFIGVCPFYVVRISIDLIDNFIADEHGGYPQ